MPSSARPAAVDDVSRQIIEQLQEDGRRPYATIGRAVGLSEAAVRQRVQRLLESGVMTIRAVAQPESVGLKRQATVGVRSTGDPAEVTAAMARLEGVTRVVSTAGSFDHLVDVVCEDDACLLELLRRIRSVRGVVATESFVHLACEAD